MNSRAATLLTTLGAAVALLSTVGAKSAHYIWNASASVPIGLYRLRPTGNLFVTELVAVQPPEPTATFLSEGGYLPRGLPMLKRVLALPGQTVCRDQLTSRSTRSRWVRRVSATAEADRFRFGKAAASSPTARSSS